MADTPDAIHATVVDQVEPRPTVAPEVRPAVEEKPATKPNAAQNSSPQAICTQMGKPELPSVAWSGLATVRVQADVRAGRVTAVQFLSTTGGMDARSKRAIQRAIEATLTDTYVCPGDHRFEQEFAVRVE